MKQAICVVLTFIVIFICLAGVTEQRQYGDYIYIPASGSITAADVFHLSVKGIGYDPETGEAQQIENLTGADFGVYVISAGGEVRAWANPLYPTEQMKIRTGADGASFTLPAGREYYLIQESTQSGYLFDPEALIPVNEEQLTVENYMPAMVAVQTGDSLQVPLEGLSLQLMCEDGSVTEADTDDSGWARFTFETAVKGEVMETALPDGVYPALRSLIGDTESEMPVRVDCALGTCVLVRFEHPALGYVQMNASLLTLDDSGEKVTSPLAGVSMHVLSDPEQILTTNEDGFIETALLEGTYSLLFTTEDEDVRLPFDHASLVIESGGVTSVPVEAVLNEGRIILEADYGKYSPEGTVSIYNGETNELVLEAKLPETGRFISSALMAGSYRVHLDAGMKNRITDLYSEQMDGQTDGIAQIKVLPGKVSTLEAEVAVPELQQYVLAVQTLTEDGEILVEPMQLSGTGVLQGDGFEPVEVRIEKGRMSVETFPGEYTLELDTDMASEKGVRHVSNSFSLPSGDETIIFPISGGRILLRARDGRGDPAVEGVYQITDATGLSSTVTTDENGLAVTPILSEGIAEIENLEVPVNCEKAQNVQIQISSGELALTEIEHPRRGMITFTVSKQSVENGQLVYTPAESIGVEIRAVGMILDEDMVYRETDENGIARVLLPAGTYEAVLAEMELAENERMGEPVRFTVQNNVDLEEQLVYYDTIGGIEVRLQNRGEIEPILLTQMQFILSNDQMSAPLQLKEDAFVADGFPAGVYTLEETQAPVDYSLMKPRTVQIAGGEITRTEVPLEEYATVTVTKYGLTFDDRMNNYIVPLSGGYKVYVLEGGETVPYPDAQNQLTVYSNVAADSELPSRIQLPAEDEGTVYYLKEIEANAGFALDTEVHEIRAFPGETYEITCSVSSDRGFYHLTLTDAETQAPVSGAHFVLRNANGDVLSSFDLGDGYRNEMAIPIGDYTLTETSAAPGYMLTETEQSFRVEPYLTMGGQVSEIAFTTQRIPAAEWGDTLFNAVTVSQEHGITLLTVDPAACPDAMAFEVPEITVRVTPETGKDAGIRSLTLNGIREDAGNSAIRVEYMVEGSGWQMGKHKLLTADGMPGTVIFPENELVSTVRLTYLDAETGLEHIDAGFIPADFSVQVCGYGEEPVEAEVETVFTGIINYRTDLEKPEERCSISSRTETAVLAVPCGANAPVAMGRDGRISGLVFYDEEIDGLIRPDSKPLGGIKVSLCDKKGNVIDTTVTDEEGYYAFEDLSVGTYTLEFESDYIYTYGELYTQYLCSRVSTTGLSDPVVLNAEHTDEWLLAGCVTPARVSGMLRTQISADQYEPLEGCPVEFWKLGQEEPVLVVTDPFGAFLCNDLLPGDYEIRIELPDGDLGRDEENGWVVNRIFVAEGERLELNPITAARAAGISGRVQVDKDGDGRIDGTAEGVGSIRVELSKVNEDGHTETRATTVTDASGAYSFGNIYPGEYLLNFILTDNWVFTKYGEDSHVFGSVSETGSTKPFHLECGELTEKNAGVTIPSELTVMVYKDLRMDGIKQPNEEGIDGIRISLIRVEQGEDAEVLTSFTDPDGLVKFSKVSPGEYRLEYRMTGAWRATVEGYSDNSPAFSFVAQSTEPEGRSTVFTIPMGSALDLYIGAVQTGEISGRVFYDDNADAAMASEEVPAPGVAVVLLNANEEPIGERVTSEDGSFQFTGLPAGRYKVRFTTKQDECFSGNERTANRNWAERNEGNVSTTRVIILEGGRSVTNVTAGIVRLARIRGQIFIDRNGNSIWDPDEPAMPGITVALTKGPGKTVVAETKTDGEGKFVFDDVYPGEYRLRVDAGEAYVYAGDTPESPLPMESHTGSWYYSAPFTMLGNAEADGIVYGFLQQSVIRGIVWEDRDYDGRMNSENGLRYVQVTLFDSTGKEHATTRTDRDGGFEFAGLMPDIYSLEFVLESGYVFTVDGQESIAPRQNSTSCSVSLDYLEMGEVRENIRIGALKPGRLSGYVWYDANGDGRRQADSQLLTDIPVTLRVVSGSDEGLETAVVTDENGKYSFENVMPGTVVLRAELPEECAFTRNASGTKRVSIIPETDKREGSSNPIPVETGVNLTELDIGAVGIGSISGSLWMDTVYDGRRTEADEPLAGVRIDLLDASTGAKIKTVKSTVDGTYQLERVRMGEYKIRFTLPTDMVFTMSGEGVIPMLDVNIAETETIQLQMGEHLTGISAGAIVPAVLNGVFLDEDTETGLSPVMISLMEGGTAVFSTKTDQDGQYSFGLIRPGTYRLRYTLPTNTLFALSTPLHLTDTDALEGETNAFVVAIGQQITMNPLYGVRSAALTGRTWSDANVNSRMDSGEKVMPDVHITLTEAETGRVVAEQMSDVNGSYFFDNLRRGTYVLKIVLPQNELFTDRGKEIKSSCITPSENNEGESDPFELDSGKTIEMNIGSIRPGMVGDTVWQDLNGNGLQDYREPLLSDVPVILLTVDDNGNEEEVAVQYSDEYGYYHFTGLRPGRYFIRVDDADEYTFTIHYGSPLDEIDSDIIPETGETETFLLQSGERKLNIDIGILPE